MTVIASDERDLEPAVFDKIVIGSGERYDIVINANKKPRTYWIIVQGLARCNPSVYQIAALKYVSNEINESPAVHPIFPISTINPNAVILNNDFLNCTYIEKTGRCISQMKSKEKTPFPLLLRKPDFRFTLNFDFHVYDQTTLFDEEPLPYFVAGTGNHLLALMNNISSAISPSPLLSQKLDIPEDLFCKPECQSSKRICECLNIIKVPLNSIVEFIIDDIGILETIHPFHLHGHSFHVVAQGQWGPDRNASLQELYRVRFW
uniref:Plastocyanin-like domain-containing protein n=1 Tax=Clastoptera arizonana TaxID=38151 RepID=A0A1B6DT36_9HEMI